MLDAPVTMRENAEMSSLGKSLHAYAMAYKNRGSIYYELKQYRQAAADWEKAVSLDGRSFWLGEDKNLNSLTLATVIPSGMLSGFIREA